jgi:hypothetical protein
MPDSFNKIDIVESSNKPSMVSIEAKLSPKLSINPFAKQEPVIKQVVTKEKVKIIRAFPVQTKNKFKSRKSTIV